MVFYLICLCVICVPPRNPRSLWRFNTAASLILFCTRYFGLGFWAWAFLELRTLSFFAPVTFRLGFCYWVWAVVWVHALTRESTNGSRQRFTISCLGSTCAKVVFSCTINLLQSSFYTHRQSLFVHRCFADVAGFLCHPSLLIEQQFIETTDPQNDFFTILKVCLLNIF